MDAHLFRLFYRALLPTLHAARLEKIQEPFPGFLTFSLLAAGQKLQLCWNYGKEKAFAFLTSERINTGSAPSSQIMRLRKYALGKRIRTSVMQFDQRRLWLLMGKLAQNCDICADASLVWLCLDLRSGASLHFLKAESTPEASPLCWPAPDKLTEACSAWRQWPVLTPALRRTLIHLDEKERAALLVDLQKDNGNVFLYRNPKNQNICSVGAWPLPPKLQGDLVEENGENVLALLEKAGQGIVLLNLAEKEVNTALQPLERQRVRLERLRQRLQEEEKRLTAMLAVQAEALALQENLWRLPDEVRGGTITIPGDRHGAEKRICLTVGRTAKQEMAHLFHTVKRGRRGLEHLARRRAALEEELAALAQTRRGFSAREASPQSQAGEGCPTSAPPKNLPPNIRVFKSDDGFIMLRGRDAQGNLAARKLAAPHDIWLHAADGPGAHVIIRRAYAGQNVPEQTLVQAGILAACKSWAAAAGKALVVYAEIRHVKTMRNSPKGAVRIDKICCSRQINVDLSLEKKLLWG